MAFNGAFFGRGRGGYRGGYRGNNYNPNHHSQQQNNQNNQVNTQKHGGSHRGGYQNPGFQQTFAASEPNWNLWARNRHGSGTVHGTVQARNPHGPSTVPSTVQARYTARYKHRTSTVPGTVPGTVQAWYQAWYKHGTSMEQIKNQCVVEGKKIKTFQFLDQTVFLLLNNELDDILFWVSGIIVIVHRWVFVLSAGLCMRSPV